MGVPAHVTLLYPFLPPTRIDSMDVDRLAGLFAAVPPQRFHLVAVRRFPGVVYLAPEPAQAIRELTVSIWALYPEVPPYGGTFSEIVPHLTVAQTDDQATLEEVESAVAPGLPIAASAGEAWLMVEGTEGRWRVGHRFPFLK